MPDELTLLDGTQVATRRVMAKRHHVFVPQVWDLIDEGHVIHETTLGDKAYYTCRCDDHMPPPALPRGWPHAMLAANAAGVRGLATPSRFQARSAAFPISDVNNVSEGDAP